MPPATESGGTANRCRNVSWFVIHKSIAQPQVLLLCFVCVTVGPPEDVIPALLQEQREPRPPNVDVACWFQWKSQVGIGHKRLERPDCQVTITAPWTGVSKLIPIRIKKNCFFFSGWTYQMYHINHTSLQHAGLLLHVGWLEKGAFSLQLQVTLTHVNTTFTCWQKRRERTEGEISWVIHCRPQ